ncbi:MAG: ABC transporter ATP-binding protein [Flavobacteriales bacterium]|nr:ABC transporter ATP-binding protein [Flavobacteriales bacterium]
MNPPLLHIHDLRFAFGEGPVLRDVSLSVAEGEVLVIVGPSGCGKTTLLRLIAGLERPAAGSIEVQGRALNAPGTFVAPEERPVGFVFQGLALFPHLTVRDNVGFGLAHLPRAERHRRVLEELRTVGLAEFAARYPHELSGGQQQRVAIARSLVRRPALMLMDEPFSDLDRLTRMAVRKEVLGILRDHRTAAIIVTHDRQDAYHVADRIAEMDAGRLVRVEHADVFRAEWRSEPFL